MGARILLVDDDHELRGLLRDYLAWEGFEVEAAGDGDTAVTMALTGRHDLLVLDVMLPGCNGFEALARIRRDSAVPVLMLSARGDDRDRITGLELGADDYVPKSCSPRELSVRIRAILKRGNRVPAPRDVVVAGALKVWPGQRRVERAGQPVKLTSTEFNLLEILALNAGRPVSKEVLSEAVLGRKLSRFDRAVDVHVSSIRQKIGPLADGRPSIQAVVRRGYQLVTE